MGRRLFSILALALVLASSRVDAGCIDAAPPNHATVSITRHFDAQEQEERPGVVGIRGTGWFLSPTSMVTVDHVAAAMSLSGEEWKPVEIAKGESRHSIPARLHRLAGPHAQKIAVLELQTAHPDIQGFQLRMEPLVPEEPVVSFAYPGGHLRVVGGRFVQYGDSGKFTGAALLEMYDGYDRLVLDHGSSGAPVLDCAGRVVAVVSNLFTTTIPFIAGTMRVSTAWGSANVVSVPVPVLKDLPRVE